MKRILSVLAMVLVFGPLSASVASAASTKVDVNLLMKGIRADIARQLAALEHPIYPKVGGSYDVPAGNSLFLFDGETPEGFRAGELVVVSAWIGKYPSMLSAIPLAYRRLDDCDGLLIHCYEQTVERGLQGLVYIPPMEAIGLMVQAAFPITIRVEKYIEPTASPSAQR